DNSFTCWTNHQLLLQFRIRVDNELSWFVGIVFESVMSDHRAFLRKPFSIFFLRFEHAFRDENREIRILMTGFLKHPVKFTLHLLPNSITVGLDHHTASNT